MRTPDEWKGRPCVDVTTAAYASTIDFIREAERERLAIPAFQRGYVWGPAEALALMDSMMRGFPIGNLLIWYPNAGPSMFWPSDRGIVLDGQQRITTLRGALLPGARGGTVPRIAFDLLADDFIVLDGEPTPMQFPIAKVIANRVGFREHRQIMAAIGSPDDTAEYGAQLDAIWRARVGETIPRPPDGKRPKGLRLATWEAVQSEWATAREERAQRNAPTWDRATEYAGRLGEVIDRLRYHRIAITAIRGGALDDVREVFRRINLAGRPLDEAGIDALLRTESAA